VLIGEPPSAAPLALFPCRNCHGDDGRGIVESGVVAPDIRWSHLSKPYSVLGGRFRLRPAYDGPLLARALRDGVDSGGQPLAAAMPRYLLSERELAGLTAYLRQLDGGGAAAAIGEEIPIGVRLPAALQAAARRRNETLRAVLETYFAWIDGRGGIFQRQVRLTFYPASEPFPETMTAGLDLTLPETEAKPPPLPADRVPVIALFASPSDPADAATGLAASSRFELYSGPEDRAEVLRHYARSTLGLDADEILELGGDLEGRAVDLRRPPRAVLYDGRDADALRRVLARLSADTDLLLGRWLESPELMELAENYSGPVHVAVPPTPHLLSVAGRELYARLAELRPLPREQLMAQLWTLAAAETLTAALERVGRDLHPQALIRVLEGFYRHETGLGPPLTFSPSRRIGAPGAVVLRLLRGRDSIEQWQWIPL
jgi:hypothetical protein